MNMIESVKEFSFNCIHENEIIVTIGFASNLYYCDKFLKKTDYSADKVYDGYFIFTCNMTNLINHFVSLFHLFFIDDQS
jgi:hypothetical protein